jgi:hypothetical protein
VDEINRELSEKPGIKSNSQSCANDDGGWIGMDQEDVGGPEPKWTREDEELSVGPHRKK